jgi:glycosyltransferase
MENQVSISIITATFNSAEHLRTCLLSIATQTYSNIEHIVIDGASNDGTIEIIKETLNNTKFKSEIDKGIYDALNKGIKLANGEVIGFLHSDDFYASDKVLEKVANAFQNDPSLCAVYGDLMYVKRDDTKKIIRKWRSKEFKKSLLSYGWMPPHTTLFVKREWYLLNEYFDMSYTIAADYHSILKLFSGQNNKFKYLPETLIKMRTGGISNRSIYTILKKTYEDWRALRSCKFTALGSVKAIIFKNLRKISQFF